MNINSISTASSVKLPKLKNRQKLLITEPDDKGFAKDQADKIIQGIYLRKQLKLKPWEKDSYKNIYTSSGESNHQILKKLKLRIRSGKTLNSEDLSNSGYYKESEIKSINDSQEISKHIKLNSEIKNKVNVPNTNIKSYTINTKEMCKSNMLSEYIQIERDKLKNKYDEYEKSLQNEIKNLDKDIFKFEVYATNELLKKNLAHNFINNIEIKRKNKAFEIKKLTQQYHSLQDEIPKVIKSIDSKRIYTNFLHRLLGGEAELANCKLDDLDFHKMNDNQIHSVVNKIQDEMDKTKSQKNILKTSTEEELLTNINKLDIVFKLLEEKIMKTLAIKEQIRNEIVLIVENAENEIEDMKNKILEREIEYKKLLEEYGIEKENTQFYSLSNEKYNSYMRKLCIDLYESEKDTIIKNKNDIDEYNINDKIIKPILKDMTNKERKLESLIVEMEKCCKEDKNIFNNSVAKIKKENKIVKYYEEKNNRDIKNAHRNAQIMDKINKIMITGKHKYKMPLPLDIVKKKRNQTKELKTETSDVKLLYY